MLCSFGISTEAAVLRCFHYVSFISPLLYGKRLVVADLLCGLYIIFYILTCSCDLYQLMYQLHVLFVDCLFSRIWILYSPQRRLALQQGLSGDITSQDRRQLQRKLKEVEGKIKKCVSWIQGCERRIHDNENSIAEERKEGKITYIDIVQKFSKRWLTTLIGRAALRGGRGR